MHEQTRIELDHAAQTTVQIAAPRAAGQAPRGTPHGPVPLKQVLELWDELGFASVLDKPRVSVLPDMARRRDPIIIGRTLIGVRKASGKWMVDSRVLQNAAGEIAALASANLEDRTALASPAPEWQAQLVKALDDEQERLDLLQRIGRPSDQNWFPSREWGFIPCFDLAAKQDGTWSIPSAFTPMLQHCWALRAANASSRERCTRCGGAVQDYEAQSVHTGSGWDGLCEPCFTAHAATLREYAGHLRDVQYKNEQIRKNDPAKAYRCAVCDRPAATWDHCHEHGYIRGPLCYRCNQADYWLGKPYGHTNPPRPPIEHLRRCKGCAQVGPGPAVHAALINTMLPRQIQAPLGHCHPGEITTDSYPDRAAIAAALARPSEAALAAAWSCTACPSRWELDLAGSTLAELEQLAARFLHDGEIHPAPGWYDQLEPTEFIELGSRRGRSRPYSVPAQVRFLAGRRRDGMAELARSLDVSEQTVASWLGGHQPRDGTRAALDRLVDAKLKEQAS